MATLDSKNIDVEIKIRTNRILKVLDETIQKIELSLYLSLVLKNVDRFSSQLTVDEFIALSKCETYLSLDEKDIEETPDIEQHEGEIKLALLSESLKKESELLSMETAAQHFAMEYQNPTTNNIEDPSVKRAIYILWKHPDVMHVAKTEYLKLTKESPGFIFLEKMHALQQCAYTRMMEDLSPEAERKKILYYKDIWCKNDEAITKINALKPILNDIMARVQVEIEDKNKHINEMYSHIKNLEIKFKEEIKKICADSERNIDIEITSSEACQEVVQNDIKKLEETFQNTLNEHRKQEKELRIKRYNIESQLEECLETYDIDMGERQMEYEDILAEYEEEQRQMAILQEKFDEQEKEYIILMEEKAYEEHLELERKIEDLRRRIAACIIQRQWRGLKQRRLERAKSKKARKGKGKKKGGEKSPQKK